MSLDVYTCFNREWYRYLFLYTQYQNLIFLLRYIGVYMLLFVGQIYVISRHFGRFRFLKPMSINFSKKVICEFIFRTQLKFLTNNLFLNAAKRTLFKRIIVIYVIYVPFCSARGFVSYPRAMNIEWGPWCVQCFIFHFEYANKMKILNIFWS